jgi:catechol 2,3-dioxygenase-like lactoylglutathione lyase family enzyme
VLIETILVGSVPVQVSYCCTLKQQNRKKMLDQFEVIGFIPITDAARARVFYEQSLGLRFLSDDQFALVMEANRTKIRLVRMKEFTPAPFTILGWETTEIEQTVRELIAKGVVFQRYPFVTQDELGIWNTPNGSRVAWFQDPDGNILSISQH